MSPDLPDGVHHWHEIATGDELRDVADVIDLVCASLAAGLPERLEDETGLRKALFALLDHPRQDAWEMIRDEWVTPAFLPAPPSWASLGPRPAGTSLAEACAAYGLPPEVCPSRVSLLRILRWAVREWMRCEGEGDGA